MGGMVERLTLIFQGSCEVVYPGNGGRYIELRGVSHNSSLADPHMTWVLRVKRKKKKDTEKQYCSA